MVKVCIHHPVNPEKSKTCMENMIHDASRISDLVIPFADEPHSISLALNYMIEDGSLSEAGRREIYDEIEQGIRDRIEAARQIKLTHNIWIPTEAANGPTTCLNLNDPRIAEIHIKYRD